MYTTVEKIKKIDYRKGKPPTDGRFKCEAPRYDPWSYLIYIFYES